MKLTELAPFFRSVMLLAVFDRFKLLFFLGQRKKMQFQKKKFSISSALFTVFFELGQFFQADFQVKNCAPNLLDRQYITLQGNWNLQFKTSESR